MVFGAAATSGKLLGLDQVGLARALGQAFVTAPIIYDMTDRRLRAFAHRVRSEANPAWGPILASQLQGGGVFRRTPTEVIVRTHSSQYRKSAENACGDPWAPGFEMSDAQLLAKVHRFTDQFLGPDRSDNLIEAVFSMDTAEDVGAIVAAMRR
jgi:2-methylcitrate dehydratase PrpD